MIKVVTIVASILATIGIGIVPIARKSELGNETPQCDHILFGGCPPGSTVIGGSGQPICYNILTEMCCEGVRGILTCESATGEFHVDTCAGINGQANPGQACEAECNFSSECEDTISSSGQPYNK